MLFLAPAAAAVRARCRLLSASSRCAHRLFSSKAVASNNREVDNKVLLSTLSDDGVLTLTLNRPKQHHALSLELLDAMHRELSVAASFDLSKNPSNHDTNIRVVVITSSGDGPVFSSGHDLKELVLQPCESNDNNSATPKQVLQKCQEVMTLLGEIPQPTIASVNGLAVAAGCQLVAACDLVLATPRSQFMTPGASTIGLFCHTPAVELIRSVGPKIALDMLYSGRALSCHEALQYGLVSRIVDADNGEETGNEGNTSSRLQQVTNGLASKIASQSVVGMQLGKQTLYKQYNTTAPTTLCNRKDAYALATKVMLNNLESEDAQAGIKAFLNKQERPEWKHK